MHSLFPKSVVQGIQEAIAVPTAGGVAEFVRILPNVVSTPASEQNSYEFCYGQGDVIVQESGWSSSDQIEREISMFKLRILLRRLPRVMPRMRAVWT